MALAMRQAAPLKPEIKLYQALSEFEAALQPEHKTRFHNYKTQSAPGVEEVIKLTWAINEDDHRHSRRRQFLASKVTTFLHFVQQSSTVIDAIFDAVGNPIASAVWGVLKTVLKLATRSAAYFEKLTSLFKTVGNDAPAYHQYSAIFAGSAALKDALCNYLRTVVELCHDVVSVLQANFLVNVYTPLGSSKLDEYQQTLSGLGKAIRLQAAVASDQVLVNEHKEASLFRRRASEKDQADTRIACLSKRSGVLAACTPFNHRVSWQKAQKQGSTSWLQQTPQYRLFQSPDSQERLLILAAELGTGKTIIAANVITERIATTTDPVLYVLSSSDDQTSLRCRTVLGSIVRQALERLPQTASVFDHFAWSDMTADEVMSALYKSLSDFSRLWIVLDGLDESKDLEGILTYMADLQKQAQKENVAVKIFFTCRSHLTDLILRKLGPGQIVRPPKVNPELNTWIHEELANRYTAGQLHLGSPALLDDIEKELIGGVRGMYLWAWLQIETLCEQSTDHAILKSPKNLPRDLSDTFDACLKRLPSSNMTSGKLCVSTFWRVMAAIRPLHLDEIRVMLSISIGSPDAVLQRPINDIRHKIRQCGPLLTIDEDDETVTFIHPSVRQHLNGRQNFQTNRPLRVPSKSADIQMGEICVTYLSSTSLRQSLVRVREQVEASRVYRAETRQHLESLPSHLLNNMDCENSVATRLTARLAKAHAKSKRQPLSQAGDGLMNESSLDRRTLPVVIEEGVFPLLDYCQEYWLLHTMHITFSGRQSCRDMFWDLMEQPALMAHAPWLRKSTPTPSVDANLARTEWIIRHQHLTLLEGSWSEIMQNSDHPTIFALFKSKQEAKTLLALAKHWQKKTGLHYEYWLYFFVRDCSLPLLSVWLADMKQQHERHQDEGTPDVSGLSTIFHADGTHLAQAYETHSELLDKIRASQALIQWQWIDMNFGFDLTVGENSTADYTLRKRLRIPSTPREIRIWPEPPQTWPRRPSVIVTATDDISTAGWHPVTYAAALMNLDALKYLLASEAVSGNVRAYGRARLLCAAVREVFCSHLLTMSDLTTAPKGNSIYPSKAPDHKSRYQSWDLLDEKERLDLLQELLAFLLVQLQSSKWPKSRHLRDEHGFSPLAYCQLLVGDMTDLSLEWKIGGYENPWGYSAAGLSELSLPTRSTIPLKGSVADKARSRPQIGDAPTSTITFMGLASSFAATRAAHRARPRSLPSEDSDSDSPDEH